MDSCGDVLQVDDAEAVEIWGRAVRGHAAVERRLAAIFRERFALGEAEAETLLSLHRAPSGRETMKELARTAAFSAGGFTKIADRLAARGFVERIACSEDRRVTWLSLTPPGAGVAAELTAATAAANRAHVIDVLGLERSRELARMMTELYRANASA